MLLARTAGVPVIVDESVTGFGRTGVMWSQEHTGMVADVTVVGGPVGGGLPLGAVVARSGALPAGLDTSPHAGHPWACAAGFVVAETINPAMFTHADDCGRELASALGALCGQFPDRLAGHHGVACSAVCDCVTRPAPPLWSARPAHAACTWPRRSAGRSPSPPSWCPA